MYLKMKQNFLIQMLAVSSYLMSTAKAEEWIIDIDRTQFSSVVHDIAQLQRDGSVQMDATLSSIADLIIHSDERTAHTIAEMPGVNSISVSTMGDFHVLGWPDQVQPEETGARRKLAQAVPYGIKMVGADVTNGGLAPGDTAIKVCVVDTGYDNTNQEDNPEAVGGYSYYTETGETNQKWDEDGHGHGTHCAGTIGALNNDVGVIGVVGDPEVDPFFIGKGLRNGGSGTSAAVMAAVEACVDAGAKVISMSLGGGGYSSTAEAQYEQHYLDNVLIIAAAGNGGSPSKSYPASYPAVMSVAAVDSSKNKASFSQYNDQVEIAAPGVGVESTLPNNQYASWSGTSMACPHVAGVAALVWSHFPECSAQDIRFALDFSAEDVGSAGCDIEYGYGIVNAVEAKAYLDANGCSGAQPTKTEGGCSVVPEGPTPSPDPTFAPTPCNGVDALFSIKIDNYGKETDWRIKKDGFVVEEGSNYDGNSLTEVDMCLQEGSYVFDIKDDFGDGICCSYGNGFYKLEAEGEVKFEGGQFGSAATHEFTISGSSNTCKDWCAAISIPWKSPDPSATQKCNFTGHCNTCTDCN